MGIYMRVLRPGKVAEASAIGVIIMCILFIYASFYLKVSARWEVRL